MNFNQLIRALPLFILLILSIALSSGVFNQSRKPEDTHLIGKKISYFNIPILGEKNKWLSPASFQGKTVVIHIFASWCKPCEAEHAVLMNLANTQKVSIYGVAWRDKAANVSGWLNKMGNPYQLIAVDEIGISSTAFAVRDIPDTFVISKDGVIRFHTSNPLTEDVVDNTILPLIDKLNANNK